MFNSVWITVDIGHTLFSSEGSSDGSVVSSASSSDCSGVSSAWSSNCSVISSEGSMIGISKW